MHDVLGLGRNLLEVALISVPIERAYESAQLGIFLLEVCLLVFHEGHKLLLLLVQIVPLLIHAVVGFFWRAEESPASVVVFFIDKFILEALEDLIDSNVREDLLGELGDVVGG